MKPVLLTDAEFLRHCGVTALFRVGPPPPVGRYIAVAGARDPSEAGLRLAAEVGRLLAKRGAVVVTGMARGIDFAAAVAAVRAGGRAVGVWPAVYIKPGVLDPSVESYSKIDTVLALSLYPSQNFATLLAARSRLAVCISEALIVPEARYRQAGWGTAVAVAHALKLGKRVVVIKPHTDQEDVVKAYRFFIERGAAPASTPEEAVSLVF